MRTQILFVISIFFIAIIAILLIWKSLVSTKTSMNIRFKRNRYKEFKDTVQEQFDNQETNKLFEDSGIPVSGFYYQLIRWSMVFLWFIYLFYLKFNTLEFTRSKVLVLVIFIFATSPRKQILGRKSPLIMLLEIFQNRFKEAKNNEIYMAMSQLKNISISDAQETYSSDYILEELMKYTKITKPIFTTMLKMWYKSEKDVACEYFAKAIDTREGKEISNIFRKLDELKPSELKEQIILYQNTFEEERKAQRINKKTTKGNWIFAMATFSATVVLFNFVVIVITIDALNTYKNIVPK